MPGWYVHMEAAALTAERMRQRDLPTDFPSDPGEIASLGDICHRWRNYLELGALGPDLFFMLPDFAGTKGTVIRHVLQWTLTVWRALDDEFISKWDKWVGPISDNTSSIIAQIDGGVLNMLGQALDNLAAAAVTAVKGLLAEMGDWFGVLTSGVPQGYGDSAFYWSDMFHYRRTYQVPFLLYSQARAAYEAAANDTDRQDAEARLAFAVGWMSHCATDVAGHPFTNAKCGGPYRDHWQRHHLIENHMDAQNYVADHPGPLYDEVGVSALHFRVAFRAGRADYPGRSDAPAYDFTHGLPSYPTGHSAQETAERDAYFDLKSGPFPKHLGDAIRRVMQDAYGDDGPKILAADPAFSAIGPDGRPDGRPNDAALDEMWSIIYGYLAMSSSDGLNPYAPSPPPVINDHSFPQPPGGDHGVDDDPGRGADVEDSDFTLLDLLLAIVAWAIYLAQVAIWIATVLPGLIADIATFPLRLVLYYAFVVPAWNLYLLTRRALVMTGFLIPNRSEIDLGLTTMGQKAGQADSFIADLDAPSGFASWAAAHVTEPSGRADASQQFGLDGGYPRNIVRDDEAAIDAIDLPGLFGLTGVLHYAGDVVDLVPSEWLKPWNYPLRTPGGVAVPREEGPAHVGPFVLGDTSTALLDRHPGHRDALQEFEAALSPADTAEACLHQLPLNRHMGAPVDYGTYLVVRFVDAYGAEEAPVPDFNLDADRGYAWHAWDWNRHRIGPGSHWRCTPGAIPGSAFGYAQPCTPPQFFHADTDNPARAPGGVPHESQWFDPARPLATHYLNGGRILGDRAAELRRAARCGAEPEVPREVVWPRPDSWSLWREQHDG